MTKIKVIGSGTVTQHPIHGGRVIQIKAVPDIGAAFVRWEKLGKVLSTFSVCNLNISTIQGEIVAVFSKQNAERLQFPEPTLQPEYSEIKMEDPNTKQHTLLLKNAGSGGGVITINPQREHFSFGEEVSFKAVANDGSYFKVWEIYEDDQLIGDEGLKQHTELILTMPDKGEEKIICINAIFESLFTEDEASPNDFIRAVLRPKKFEYGRVDQYIYELQLFNLKDISLNIKVPLTEKIIDNGKKVPQKKWGGSVNGVKGITLEANGFCEIFLVYLEEWMPNEKIIVLVNLPSLEVNLIFKFRAPKIYANDRKYRLVDCQSTSMEGKAISKTNNREWVHLLDRVDFLEASISNALSRLAFLEQHLSAHRLAALSDHQLAINSFDDVIHWLLEEGTVALSDMRARLLPLSLLTGPVITDLNEKALDQMGELALNEDGEKVIVNRSILRKVIGKN